MADSNLSVRVELKQRSYEIRIGSGCLSEAGRFFCQRGAIGRAILISDSSVAPSTRRQWRRAWRQPGRRSRRWLSRPVSRANAWAKRTGCGRSYWSLAQDRKTLVVAVGGGVVGDLAGFVAATFARGLPFAQVPTTLLAQVDSSVGGKVGINLPVSKNMVGAFWQPVGVLADTQTLKTLPEREYRAGLAEVVKYGVILDANFFARLERDVAGLVAREPAVIAAVIERCCRLKADVVEMDEREETGQRAVLNYGHTFCHALEAATGYGQLLHGEGVSIGMMCAARLAQRMRRVDEKFVDRQQALLEALGLPIKLPAVDPDRLLAIMQHDKKTEAGRLEVCVARQNGTRGDSGQHRCLGRTSCPARIAQCQSWQISCLSAAAYSAAAHAGNRKTGAHLSFDFWDGRTIVSPITADCIRLGKACVRDGAVRQPAATELKVSGVRG